MLEEETNDPIRQKLVLIISRHEYIVESTQKLLAQQKLRCEYLLEDTDDIVSNALKYDYDLLFIVGSVEPHLVEELCNVSKKEKPNAKVLIHKGGPATIPTEVSEALAAN